MECMIPENGMLTPFVECIIQFITLYDHFSLANDHTCRDMGLGQSLGSGATTDDWVDV